MPSLRQQILLVMKKPPYGPFQVHGVRFFIERKGRGLLGDDRGLGKTYQTIAYLALFPTIRPVLICCESNMKWKWEREFRKFAGVRATVLNGFKPHGAKITIWKKEKGVGPKRRTIRWFRSISERTQWLSEHNHRVRLNQFVQKQLPKLSSVLIANYDILIDWEEHLQTVVKPVAIVMDECQKIKERSARRTKIVNSLATRCKVRIGLSGTPIRSRPAEFFNILHLVDQKLFPSIRQYRFEFCDPKLGFRGQWDYSGASNLKKLHRLVKQVMLRRLKSQVLKELPTKVRTVIPIEIDNMKEYREARDNFISWLTDKKGPGAAKRAKGAIAIVKLTELKQVIARGKLSSIKKWAIDWLEETGEKLVLFAVNTEIVDAMVSFLPGTLKVNGPVPSRKRLEIEDEFNNNPKRRLIVGNIEAMGRGMTLIGSSTVAFAQLGWTPDDHDQPEDRVLRIGQKSDHMNAYYFIAKGTIEEDNLEMIEQKREVVGQILDGDAAEKVETRIIERMLERAGKLERK